MIRDCAYWSFCWLCWRAYTWLPWAMVRGRFGMSILPHAGLYAYSDDFADFRATMAWNRAGRPSP